MYLVAKANVAAGTKKTMTLLGSLRPAKNSSSPSVSVPRLAISPTRSTATKGAGRMEPKAAAMPERMYARRRSSSRSGLLETRPERPTRMEQTYPIAAPRPPSPASGPMTAPAHSEAMQVTVTLRDCRGSTLWCFSSVMKEGYLSSPMITFMTPTAVQPSHVTRIHQGEPARKSRVAGSSMKPSGPSLLSHQSETSSTTHMYGIERKPMAAPTRETTRASR
mmetsp:Transcript_50002/g.155005  ORF Transcript_50002/g.155005 Transcript_50002/m.155005 type:complete len:221 (+) Transcript_50002:594-1256(+)